MLDNKNTLAVKSNYIQYPVTRIQDQSILAMFSIIAAMFDFKLYATKGYGV